MQSCIVGEPGRRPKPAQPARASEAGTAIVSGTDAGAARIVGVMDFVTVINTRAPSPPRALTARTVRTAIGGETVTRRASSATW